MKLREFIEKELLEADYPELVWWLLLIVCVVS